MTNSFMGSAVFPITGNNPVAAINFFGNEKIVEEFFIFSDCPRKMDIIKSQNIRYVISPAPLECNFKVIYAQKNNIIYEVSNTE